ncbi:hypothetical protein TorRG33x02_246990 [Trema orientale]|uniref:Uncharacterized protein n=1 Tax=Trema orientale TaxID=63057 RepID=A0A2P5DMZ8_TREOI|nr:hypothetical protein TorRG33x02_246990 [Trema orientale]
MTALTIMSKRLQYQTPVTTSSLNLELEPWIRTSNLVVGPVYIVWVDINQEGRVGVTQELEQGANHVPPPWLPELGGGGQEEGANDIDEGEGGGDGDGADVEVT